MGFNLRRFLRRSPPSVLRDYFNVSVIGVAEAVDWKAQPAALVRAVSAAIDELGPGERDKITADFEQVDKLCGEIGQVALQTIAAADKDLLTQLHSAEGNEARAITVLLHDSELFDHALALAFRMACSMAAAGAPWLSAMLRSPVTIWKPSRHSKVVSRKYSYGWMAQGAD